MNEWTGTDLTTYRPFALWVAKAFFFPGADRDDVEQEAMIGLWEALERWDPKRGASLKSFVYLIVRRRLVEKLMSSQRLQQQALTESLREVELEDGPLALVENLPDLRADTAAIVEQRERLAEMVRIVSEELSPLERRALVHILNGHAYAGDKVLDNALQRARKKLQEAA